MSIDIVIGVVILLRFFCAHFGAIVGWEIYVLLGSTVWLIYTADHLRDAEKSKESCRERYVYHRKYSRQLRLVMVILFIAISPLLLFIPRVIFLGGLVLAILSVIYLLVQHKLSRFLSKEFYVSLVYSVGILMVPVLLGNNFDWVILLLLTLLAFSNLATFSWYEKKEDIADGFKSIATQMKSQSLEKVILILIALGLSISLLKFNPAYIYFFGAFLIHSALILFPSVFTRSNYYRLVGDGVFLIPIFFEWM